MNDKALFGVAGFPVNFFSSMYGKKRDNIFKWLKEIGLDVIELQCTYGVRMKEEQAIRYKELCEEYGIVTTIHAPYYINLASKKLEVVEKSKLEVIKAFELAKIVGATRVIFHPGGGYGETDEDRETGIEQIINSLNEIKDKIDTENINIYPEIGGKVAQLGSLDEIIKICRGVDFAYPCIDLAHLHAREKGSIKNETDIINVLKYIDEKLGRTYLEKTHFHVYPVDYTEKGEKEHKAFGDKVVVSQISLFEQNIEEEYLPSAIDYINAIRKMEIRPITICEAHNTQDIGAMLMRDLYNK